MNAKNGEVYSTLADIQINLNDRCILAMEQSLYTLSVFYATNGNLGIRLSNKRKLRIDKAEKLITIMVTINRSELPLIIIISVFLGELKDGNGYHKLSNLNIFGRMELSVPDISIFYFRFLTKRIIKKESTKIKLNRRLQKLKIGGGIGQPLLCSFAPPTRSAMRNPITMKNSPHIEGRGSITNLNTKNKNVDESKVFSRVAAQLQGLQVGQYCGFGTRYISSQVYIPVKIQHCSTLNYIPTKTPQEPQDILNSFWRYFLGHPVGITGLPNWPAGDVVAAEPCEGY
ncbi:unnamed protein product [Acanthoscelides obtectus]|uniref:Uncharacterized protein n=1 Tax=Acanthoscelides obtectus TaxID=200917 RepID=A0A9P0Q4V4_ACAOB|nr:unnamed protein product [Acanthoscelides obtectus]CAK1662637.1 hypothetical protein AOBTE_LOCUS23248 [Acanthoscelides obtectus]